MISPPVPLYKFSAKTIEASIGLEVLAEDTLVEGEAGDEVLGVRASC